MEIIKYKHIFVCVIVLTHTQLAFAYLDPGSLTFFLVFERTPSSSSVLKSPMDTLQPKINVSN